jgi:hypothetical protein
VYTPHEEFPRLKQLVDDTDATRQLVLDSGYENINSLEDAKGAITRIIFGGSEWSLPKVGRGIKVDWLREFAREMYAALYMLLRRFPEVYALQQAREAERANRDISHHQPSSAEGSAMSYLLSTGERWCTKLAMDALDADFDGRYKTASYLYDGFLVLRPNDMPLDAPMPAEVLDRINEYVRARTGWKRVTFVQKQLAMPTMPVESIGPDMGLFARALADMGIRVPSDAVDAFSFTADTI